MTFQDHSEDRTVVFTISKGDLPIEWKLDNFRKNPIVLWAHSYSEPPVGRATSIVQSSEELTVVVEFVPYPFADTALRWAKEGVLEVTPSFIPLKCMFNENWGGVDIQELELLVLSLVPRSANHEGRGGW